MSTSNTPLTDAIKLKYKYPSPECAQELEAALYEVESENARLRAALKPFTHEDLCAQLSGNAEGNASPVFGRNKAILTLGDFRKARAALNGGLQ